jgi:hypothetical protein
MQNQRGSISILVLILGVVFSVTIGGLVIYGSVEYSNSRRAESQAQALSIAEAGANYYRWHLNHNLNDYYDGTGQPGTYVHNYTDPQSGALGKFSLEIIPPDASSQIVTVNSTGWINSYPNIKRTVKMKLGPDPLTKYSFLHNANVWFGQGIVVYGEVFVNGGVRMDGTNESIISSAKESYTCGTETGCSQPAVKPGIWGRGGPTELWKFPVPFFDFSSIVTDFNSMKSSAQTTGLYLPFVTGSYGYHLVFNSNGTVNVYNVTRVSGIKGWTIENNCSTYYQVITTQNLQGTYNVADKNIIYAENTVWVDGTIKGKTTVIAGRLPVATYNTDLYLNGDIVYTTRDGTDNLALIAENSIMFIRDVPTDLEIDAALMAQSGTIVRPDYRYGSCTNGGQNAVRNSLTIYGTIISNQRSYWSFSDTHGVISGFVKRYIYFNQNAVNDPPPYFPTAENFKILSWEEN